MQSLVPVIPVLLRGDGVRGESSRQFTGQLAGVQKQKQESLTKQGGNREPTPESYPLTHTHASCHKGTYTCMDNSNK